MAPDQVNVLKTMNAKSIINTMANAQKFSNNISPLDTYTSSVDSKYRSSIAG